MAGTVTTTEETFGTVKKVKFAWTSAASGAADATTTYPYSGEIIRCVIIPGATTPSDLFDVEVQDADTYDLLAGLGGNCSNAANTLITGNMGAVAQDTLTLAVTNAGDSKTGTVIVYIR